MTSFKENYIKTEGRIENLDDVKEEQIVFENDTAKCGEVMIGYQGEFTFICVLCMQPFSELCSFGKHITDLHLSRNTPNTFAIESDLSRDPQCEERSAITTQRERKSGSPVLVPLAAPTQIQKELEIKNLDTVASPDSRCDASSSEGSPPVTISSNSSQKGGYVCKFCGSSYRARSSYMRHMKYKHPERTLNQMRCKFCDKEFEDEIQLETHDCTRKGRMLYVCTYCPKVFDTRQDRQSHVNEHVSCRPYKCAHCPKTFALPNYLERHISVHLRSDTNQNDSTTVSTEKEDGRDTFCAQTSSSVSPQREINSESSILLPASAPNHMQKELEIDILDSVTPSNRNDNEDSRDDGSATPIAIFLNHTKVEEFVCTVCKCSYHAKSSHKRHMKKMHPELMPVQKFCKYCDKEFDNLVQLETHVRTHTGLKRFVCPFCAKLFSTRQERQSHINVHNGEHPYKCAHCSETFAQTNNLNAHKRKYHKATNQRNSKPEQEKGILDTVAPLDGNDNACSKDDVVICNESPHCPETFALPNYVKMHISVHLGNDANQNDSTTVSTKKEDGRDPLWAQSSISVSPQRETNPEPSIIVPASAPNHIQKELEIDILDRNDNEDSRDERSSTPVAIFLNPTKVEEFVCTVCGCSYHAKSSHKRHMEKMHPELVSVQNICKYCDKEFDDSVQLETHVPTHTGLKRLLCPFCPKLFSTRQDLQSHIKVHNGERPYKCFHCPQTFALPNYLERHISVHLGSAANQNDSTTASTEKDDVSDPLCAQTSISVSPQREINSESSIFVPASAPNHIQKELEIDILDSVTPSDRNDNEDSKDEGSTTPVAIFLNPIKVEEFVCTFCGCSYHAKSSLKRHMKKMHPELVPAQKICKYCDQEFDDLVQLETHVRTHAGPKRFVCPFCPKVFSTRDSRQSHINVHNGERPHKCPHCPETFAQTNNLNTHKRKYHQATNQNTSKMEQEEILDTVALSDGNDNACLKDDVVSCKESPPVAKFLDSVPEGKFGCGYCGHSYTARSSFRRHMWKSHPDIKEDAWVCIVNKCSSWEESTPAATQEGEFVCKFCGQSYNASSSFERHMRKEHSGEEERVPDQLSCKYCYIKFDDLIQLKTHVRTHRGDKRYICPFCPKAFYSTWSRGFHVNTHTGERPYKCSLCPKAFAHVNNREKHRRSHLKIMKYGCAYCDKRFVTSTEKNLHERTHTGEKPFQCEECGQRFICRARLTEHRSIHTNARNHVCTVCSKAFLSARRLRNHSIIHRSDRPHHCNICGKRFPRRSSLTTHQQVHSDEKKYVCHICGSAFAQSSGLYSHRKSHGDKL